jgi:hypothetical protein
MPAALLEMTSNSLLMRNRASSAPESTGASSAVSFHISAETKRIMATVKPSHSRCAGPHESIANGIMNVKAVGG